MENTKNETRNSKCRKGFTLVEILIVIGIIGLLAAFLVPNLLGAKDRGKEAAVKGVMHSVQLAIESYQMENEVYPMGVNQPLESLCKNYLMAGGYIASVPKNPFTGLDYVDADSAGKIIYSYDNATGGYVLSGYKRNGSSKILELTNL
jgi:general secretion pathway protein G